MRYAKSALTVLFLACTVCSGAALAQPVAVTSAEIPEHPEDLAYDTLEFTVPDGDSFRHVLSNGIPVYIAEYHTFPLVSLRVLSTAR